MIHEARLKKWLEIAALMALASLLLWKGIVPGWKKLNTDFPNYYLVARLMREGHSLDRVYDWVWLQGIKDRWRLDQPFVGFIGLTPFSAWPVLPLALLPALTAKRIWLVVNLCFLGASVELLGRTTNLGRVRVWILVPDVRLAFADKFSLRADAYCGAVADGAGLLVRAA